MYNVFRITLILVLSFFGAYQLSALVTMELVNSQVIETDLIKNLSVLYDSDNIVLMESGDNTLILKEYMTRNRAKYYAEITKSENNITIRSGERPWLIRTRIELYIPKILTNKINVNLRSGNITISDISIKDIIAEVSSGNIKLNNCHGKLNITVRSGNVKVSDFTGEGLISVRSGNINLTVNDIAGNLSLSSNSGNINFSMTSNISFILDAEVRSGTIKAPNLRRLVNTKVKHDIGTEPVYTLLVKCGSGNININ